MRRRLRVRQLMGRIGSTEVSLAGLGCNNFGRRIDEARTKEVVDAALDSGVTAFDTADIYGDGKSEEFLGRALGPRRDDVVIVTKFGGGMQGGGRPEYVRKACDASLGRLVTDRIDVYLQHFPDSTTPVGETLAAMNELVAEGKVREIGCSNFTAEQLDEAAAFASSEELRPLVVVQNEYSLVHRVPEPAGVIDAVGRLGMSFMPYFPLASGALTGKYRRGQAAPGGTRLGGQGDKNAEDVIQPERLDVVEKLIAFAESRGHTLLELAMSWVASRPSVATVIAGATSAEQVRTNAGAFTAWQLTDDDLREIDAIAPAPPEK
jgi:aryl-alcohol dehydrogenase-like predicted oxidoreductase